MLQSRDLARFFEELQHFLFDKIQCILQDRPGIHALFLVDQKSRNPQRPHRLSRLFVYMLIIIIHKPIHAGIDRHVHLSVVQRRDACQHHRRAVGLHRRPRVKIINILLEDADGNLFVRIVPGQINAHQRDKLDLRVFFQLG